MILYFLSATSAAAAVFLPSMTDWILHCECRAISNHIVDIVECATLLLYSFDYIQFLSNWRSSSSRSKKKSTHICCESLSSVLYAYVYAHMIFRIVRTVSTATIAFAISLSIIYYILIVQKVLSVPEWPRDDLRTETTIRDRSDAAVIHCNDVLL